MSTTHLTRIAIVLAMFVAACSAGPGPSASTPGPTGTGSSAPPASGGCAPTAAPSVGPPAATPLTEPPDMPAGDGTRAVLETEAGRIVVELFTESSPVAAENFINLARAGFYDCAIFHRVIPGFVIQGGDPEGTGRGGPGYMILDDAVVGEYERGILAMARPGNRDGTPVPDSQGSQFFVILDDLRQRLPKEGLYAIFGRVVEGMDVVDAIASGDTSPDDRPLDPVNILTVTVEGP